MDRLTTPNTPQDKHSSTSISRLYVRLLSLLYGTKSSARDLKFICITGATGKSTVAHFTHEILRAAGQHVSVLASDSDISAKTLHSFIADAWKSGANYLIITASAESLARDVFYNLPITVGALTNYIDPSLSTPPVKDFDSSEAILFQMQPDHVILNSDDLYFSSFADFTGKKSTLTYGHALSSTLHISSSKLYKRGVEANLSLGSSFYTVASFLTGEPIVSYMACAAAIATALKISDSTIIEGIANYNPNSKD